MTAKLRLLWLTQHYPPAEGGMSVSCDRIVSHLRKLNVSVTLFHLKHHSPDKVIFFSPDVGSDERIGLGDNAAHGLNLLWHRIAAQQGDFDAVIGYGFPWALHGAHIFARWLNVPFISLIRGNDFDLNILDPRRSSMLMQLLSDSQAILTVSQDKASRIKSLIPDANTINIGNGIDLTLWQPLAFDYQQADNWRTERGLTKSTNVIGLIGHLKEKKGCAFFLETLIEQRLLEKNTHLLVVGTLDSATQQLLDTLPESQWTYRPLLDRFELVSPYLACSLIAIPSFYDGTPNVLLEAAALSIPVLGANCGGMADVIDDDNGWLFTPNDKTSLTSKLNDWLNCTDEAKLLKASKLQQLIVNEYDAEQEAHRYLSAIQHTVLQFRKEGN